jgi:hypothetical protein
LCRLENGARSVGSVVGVGTCESTRTEGRRPCSSRSATSSTRDDASRGEADQTVGTRPAASAGRAA